MKEKAAISKWKGLLLMRCPACRQSPMFKDSNPYHWKTMGDMHTTCPTCGQPIDQEYGFYVGAMYVSYAMMVAWNVSIAVAIYVLTGSLFDHFTLLMTLVVITSVLISPVVFRYSRVCWSYLFHNILHK